MANEVTCVTADVRPLEGAMIRRACAAAALDFGMAVYISSATGNIPNVSKCAPGALATGHMFGIVVSGSLGGTSVASGEPCDVVVLGPVTGYTGMTPGATIWASSDTAGALSTVVGAKSTIVGLAESATTVLVRPAQVVRAT
jgi:hypothetical protein